MALIEEFEKTGNWFFKHRSYLPLVLFLIAPIVILFGPYDLLAFPDVLFGLICFLISMFGLAIRSYTVGFTPKGTSGRNTEEQIAEVVNTKGIYSTVRHPLYVGNFFMWLGPIIYVGNIWFILLCSLMYWLYYERIMFAEEAFLRKKFGSQYLKWAEVTPAFIPDLSRWKGSDLPFSMKNVLKREYNGLFNTSVSFVYIDLIKNYVYFNQFYLNKSWQIIFVVCLLTFLVLRTLKKKTQVLDVGGR